MMGHAGGTGSHHGPWPSLSAWKLASFYTIDPGRGPKPASARPFPDTRGQLDSFCTIDQRPASPGPRPTRHRRELALFRRGPLPVKFVITLFPDGTCLLLRFRANWLCFARLQAWNSYSVDVIGAPPCFKERENKMSRLCGPEVPARPPATAKGLGSPSGSGGPAAHSSFIIRRLWMPVCYAKIQNLAQFSPREAGDEERGRVWTPNREIRRCDTPPDRAKNESVGGRTYASIDRVPALRYPQLSGGTNAA